METGCSDLDGVTSLLYNTTPIHCTPLRLHPPLQSIHAPAAAGFQRLDLDGGVGPVPGSFELFEERALLGHEILRLEVARLEIMGTDRATLCDA